MLKLHKINDKYFLSDNLADIIEADKYILEVEDGSSFIVGDLMSHQNYVRVYNIFLSEPEIGYIGRKDKRGNYMIKPCNREYLDIIYDLGLTCYVEKVEDDIVLYNNKPLILVN